MADEKWFHGSLSRQKAEEFLLNAGIDGSFVVRSSESISGAYALSVLHNKTVHTYRVLPSDGLLAVQTLNGVQQRKFKSISELVHEYRSPQNGLVCALTNPVGPALPFRKVSAFDNSAKTSLPSTPPMPSGRPLSAIGVKVMPDVDKSRELPPVPPPNRDTSHAPLTAKSSLPGETPKTKEAEIQSKFITRLGEIRSLRTGVNPTYIDSIQQYAWDRGLLADLAAVKRGDGQCAELQTLLAKEAVAFQSELERFLMKIDILRQLFDFSSAPRKTSSYQRTGNEDVDLDTFLGRLGDCQTVVKSLNKRACFSLQELLGVSSSSAARAPRKASKSITPLKERTFEVKQEGALKYAKHKLKLDVASGKLFIMKGDGKADEYGHSQVLQIIKNNKSKAKLTIVFEGNKKREYSFEQSAQREAFCQLLQHMRNKHSQSSEPDCVSVFCGAWNMGDAIPPADISSWFMCQGGGKVLHEAVSAIPHDIYVVGTQETGGPEKDWMHKVIETVQDITGKTFHLVAVDALWHIRIIVFVKEEHKNRISHVKTSTVKTGIANALGNKGAVGVSFQFGGTSFCFINAHLTSGSEKCARRNNNYFDIMRQMNLGEDRFRDFDLTNRFDHLYFFGDLNYRLELEIQEILAYLKKADYATLCKVDQLRREKDSNKVFNGFHEEEIAFPPTYRYERGTRESYSHLKVKKTGVRINVPSWCDRVLWRSYPETHAVCLAYGCSEDIMTSDHSPLFSNFQVGVRGQYVSNAEISNNLEGDSGSASMRDQSCIGFEMVEVILKAPGKSSFYLQFHSVCLTKYVKSKRNNKFETSDLGTNYVRLMWTKDSLGELKPIIPDREYLVDQHILVSVRSEDDNEVHAECVLALRSMIGTEAQKFEEKLTRKGEDTGQIRGSMLVRARGFTQEKTYDFIQLGGLKEDDAGKKSHMVEEAPLYECTEPPARSISKTSQAFRPRARSPMDAKMNKQFAPEVAVYGETETPEGEYADPEELGVPPIRATTSGLSISIPDSSCSGAAMAPVGFYSSAETAKFTPNPTSPEFEALPRGITAPQARRATSSSMPLTPPLSAPRQPPSGHRSPASAANILEDELFAEFDDISKSMSASGSSSLAAPTPRPRAPTPSVDQSMYDTPTNMSKNKVKTLGRAFDLTSSKMPGLAREKELPSTVAEFLRSVSLEQYSPLLHENGWDSVEFLSDITEEDLNDAGVSNPQHCRIILEKIRVLSL